LTSVALPPSPAALRASTSPIEGEVMCVLRPLHLSAGGRGRARQRAGEGGSADVWHQADWLLRSNQFQMMPKH
jgi:hypothetical protein